ncbi:MAG: HAD family hydrolase [Lachnospiraceae bacterium]|nr:HAD family hydrolase [Lachnospiraceae bacterium]
MRLFFTDLDGTLLTDDKRIGERTRQALTDFSEAGGAFAVSTGRALESAMAVQKQLGLFYPRMYLIAYNGAQIYDCDRKETIYRSGIPVEQVLRFSGLAAAHGIHLHTYNDDAIVSPPLRDEADRECMDFYRRAIKSPLILTDDLAAHLPQPPCKCIAIELHDREKLERFRQALAPVAGDGITLLYSNPYYLEIFPAEAGKGSAVTRLCEYLNIPVADAVAAGDEENDISMIRAAGLGIAMCNGSPSAIAAADAVTGKDNNHDGLADFLDRAR